ncbi:hypothetical protein IEQ34_001344 [Dendrobium chrysotoxum]|uniref:Uncharacterized protein n=1 Tax=Dendrobium chrysotoxum TaxID=161865 RepID=A0AAV7HL10_DENCH|nr:hypothetical protein IEQ34_001344 [Dendrobium chrysotoxum]
MGKKSRIAAAAAAGRNSRLIENLKTVNANLAKEAAQSLKRMEKLKFHLASMAADRDICDGLERDVLTLVLSSNLGEAAERKTVEMTAATERERNLSTKIESAVAELNAAEMRLLSLVTEKDAKNKELEDLKESLQSMEEQASERGKPWKKWLHSAAATATLLATAARHLLLQWIVHQTKEFVSDIRFFFFLDFGAN